MPVVLVLKQQTCDSLDDILVIDVLELDVCCICYVSRYCNVTAADGFDDLLSC